MRVVGHRLRGEDDRPVPFVATPNESEGIEPEFLVMHYTGGSSAAGTIDWFRRPEARASAHLVIARDGGITQMVPFDRRAWHAGASRWGVRRDLNAWSIGIELDNAGLLQRQASGWRTAFGRTVPKAELMEAAHPNGGPVVGWQTFPAIQLEVARVVAATLVAAYRLRDVVGHDDIAPGRKVDPGPAFPRQAFRSAVMGRADEREETVVTTANLHLRRGPGSHHAKVVPKPLPPGTRLRVMDVAGSWLQVEMEQGGELVAADLGGWVHGGYVRRG